MGPTVIVLVLAGIGHGRGGGAGSQLVHLILTAAIWTFVAQAVRSLPLVAWLLAVPAVCLAYLILARRRGRSFR